MVRATAAAAADDDFDAVGHMVALAGRQIVEYPHAVPAGQQDLDEMRTDKPTSSGDKKLTHDERSYDAAE